MEIIKIDNVSFRYGKQPVIKDVNLAINQGDYVLITGENGSGKSTLLKIILGELKPYKGKVLIYNKEINEILRYSPVGYVPQNTTNKNSNFPATVQEIMLTGLYNEIGLFHRPKKEHYQRITKLLKELKMDTYLNHRIGELSGGQQQKIMLAKALISNPQLLILDEPTTGIDNVSLKSLYSLLEELHQKGITILMVTHGNISQCEGVNRIIKIVDGEVSEHGYFEL